MSHLASRREHFQSEQMVRMCDPDAPTRWLADRASGQWSRNAKPGMSDAARAARTVARGLTFACTATGCSALVDLQSSRRQAGAAGRTRLMPGDGCSSRRCAAFFKPCKVGCRQNAMAAGLKAATRWLVRWNPRLDAKKVLVCSVAETVTAADAAVAALAAPTRSRRKSQPPTPAAVSPVPASPARMPEPTAGTRKRSSQRTASAGCACAAAAAARRATSFAARSRKPLRTSTRRRSCCALWAESRVRGRPTCRRAPRVAQISMPANHLALHPPAHQVTSPCTRLPHSRTRLPTQPALLHPTTCP